MGVRGYLRILFLLLVITQQVGCSSESNNKHNTVTTASEDKLTVYLNDYDDIIGPMFEDATGYAVSLVQGSGSEIMSRIEAEGDNPHWDVVWLDMMSSVHGLGLKGLLLEDYTPMQASWLKEEYLAMVPEKKWYYPTGAHAAGVIVYNHNELSEEEVPRTWESFAHPSLKQAVGIADPAIAAPAFSFIDFFFQQQGMEEGKEMMNSWIDNGLLIYPKNPNVAMALITGQIKVAALQETNAYQLLKEKEPISLVWPEEGAPASVRVAAISRETKSMEAAKAFVDFLLNPAIQQQIIHTSDEAYYEPSAKGVSAKADRSPRAELIFTDPLASYWRESEIKQWFADYSIR